MGQVLFANARIVDGTAPEARDGHVLVEDGLIREVSDRPLQSSSARVIDLAGKTLMPGLIDCHVHVVSVVVNIQMNSALPSSLTALRAVGVMRDMLMRGFTTVRDVGGADYGVKVALEEGTLQGPRLVTAGRALSQTGGHGDFRGRFGRQAFCLCHAQLGNLARVVDGVDNCRQAVREEIMLGADHIKIMASGGVASPVDPIHFMGYSRDEILAIVEEAQNHATYVCAHAYTAPAIARAVECGVRSIEHGNLVDADAARLMAERDAFAVPTLITYEALANEGASLGLPADSVAKIAHVRGAGLHSLEIFRDAGVKMAYGSDLLGDMHRHQSDEFTLRGRVLTPHEVIRSATTVAAELLRMEGRIGVVAEGAYADLIVVDGDPLKDLAVLTGQGRHMPLIMKGGTAVKDTLH
jgi:imidazolonepropionase-like amidohydrolase